MHQYLAIDENTLKPKLFIFSHCHEIINELSSLPLDKHNMEDVDTDVIDHAWDACRYGLLSRPQNVNLQPTYHSAPTVYDSTFGY